MWAEHDPVCPLSHAAATLLAVPEHHAGGPHPVSTDFATFSHLVADKRALYRAVLEVFSDAKARFVLHLRPADVAEALPGRPGLEEVETALRQLVDWGNLSADPDTAEVATVEEFYRARFLYRLTAAGEATERGLESYLARLGRAGELQTAALGDIRDLLHDLRAHLPSDGEDPAFEDPDRVAAAGQPTGGPSSPAGTRPAAGSGAPARAVAADPPPAPAEPLEADPLMRPGHTELDVAKVHLTLRALWDRFDELTERAQSFVATLQRSVELHGADVDALVAYKDGLLDYLERFISELVVAQAHIAALLREVEERGLARLLAAAADRELADALDPSAADRAAVHAAWQARWSGLVGWFLPTGERPPQAEVLRARARAAIPTLLQAIADVNERRWSRSDRAADLRALARWFGDCATAGDAHRLWRAAFALAPARHLTVDADTLAARDQDPVLPTTSWLEAPPVHISPRLRRTGRVTPRGRVRNIIDRSAEKALLARLAAEEAAQVAAARRALCSDGPVRLSTLAPLDPAAFELFLELLGAALAEATVRGRAARASTADGVLIVDLIPTGDASWAAIRTRSGVLSGPDHWVHIRPASHVEASA